MSSQMPLPAFTRQVLEYYTTNKTPPKESVWYGPWNTILNSLFPAADGFQVSQRQNDSESTMPDFILEVSRVTGTEHRAFICSYRAIWKPSALARGCSTAVCPNLQKSELFVCSESRGEAILDFRDRSTLAIWHQGGRRSTRAISTYSLAPHYSWWRFFRWFADARGTGRCTLLDKTIIRDSKRW